MFPNLSRLTPEDYNIITSKIICLFPTESPSTYYVPAIKKSDSVHGKSILARGKLVDKSRNLLSSCGSTVVRKRNRNIGQGNTESSPKRVCFESNDFHFDFFYQYINS